MPLVSLVFALFITGYILGIWTACLVFQQPQKGYEEGALWRATDGALWRATDGALWRAADGIPVPVSSTRIEDLAGTLRRAGRRM